MGNCRLAVLLVATVSLALSLSVSPLALSAVKSLPWWLSFSVDILYLQFIVVRINQDQQKLFIPPGRTTVTPQSKCTK